MRMPVPRVRVLLPLQNVKIYLAETTGRATSEEAVLRGVVETSPFLQSGEPSINHSLILNPDLKTQGIIDVEILIKMADKLKDLGIRANLIKTTDSMTDLAETISSSAETCKDVLMTTEAELIGAELKTATGRGLATIGIEQELDLLREERMKSFLIEKKPQKDQKGRKG